MRTTTFLALLLGCFAATGPAFAAPVEAVDTATVEPTAALRFEIAIRDALPVGTTETAVVRWFARQNIGLIGVNETDDHGELRYYPGVGRGVRIILRARRVTAVRVEE